MAVLEAARPQVAVPVDRNDELAAPRERIRLLTLPRRNFVMIDGAGPIDEGAFAARMPGLYATAFGLHFKLKRRGIDERVWPLELLLWSADERIDLATAMAGDRSVWRWTMMIGLPDRAGADDLDAAVEGGRQKLPPEFADGLRVEAFEEGLAAQIMHIGPYAQEAPTIERLHAGIAAAGFASRGRHHEIYLGDPRRAAPDKLRTIIRQPIREI